MFLKSMSATGVSIKFPWTLPEQPTPERRKELIELCKAGDDAGIKEMIERHLRLALFIASKYAAHSPHLVNDYVSAAFEATTEAVNRCVDSNIYSGMPTYIGIRVNAACADVLRLLCPLTLPERRKCTDEQWESIFTEYVEYDETQHSPLEINESDENIRYILSKIQTDPVDSVILLFSERGYTLKEIAKELGYHKDAIGDRLKVLWERFKAKQQELKVAGVI